MAFPPPLWPSRLFDQNFGMCITPDDFILPFYNNVYSNYYRPWKWSVQSPAKDFGSTINDDIESFKVTLDVQHFRPDELSVKVANNQIIVEGKHEERKDEHGFISRQFTRKYTLPNDCTPEDVISNLSADGVLTVVANKKIKELTKNEKVVPIKLCKSCPMKEEVVKTAMKVDQKEEIADKKTVDTSNKNKQIVLKEDHCCLLLKPELLREATSATTEIVKENKKVEQEKQACQTSKNTSEMLEQTFAKSCAMAKTGEKCDMAAMLKSEAEATNSKARAAMSVDERCEKATGVMSKSEEIFAASSITSSDENFDLFDKAGASKTELAEFEKMSSATSSSEQIGQSSMAKTEMSEFTSTSSKTSESIECTTSYKTSMTSNIKEISEDLSDFVSEILCSELDKTLEIKK